MDEAQPPSVADISDQDCRRILAAVLLEAIGEAQCGDAEAAGFLDEFGPSLCDLIGLDLTDWRRARPLHSFDPSYSHANDLERWRRYRAAKSHDQAYQEKNRERWKRTNEQRRAQRALLKLGEVAKR